MGNVSPDIPIPTQAPVKESPRPLIKQEVSLPMETPNAIPLPDITIAKPQEQVLNQSPQHEDKPKISYGSAEFLPEINTLLIACDIDPSIVNPVSIGEGANHIVFRATDGSFVVKIPKSESKVTMNMGHEDEQKQINKIKKAFPNFSLPTEIRGDEKTGKYIVIQKAVDGKSITNHTKDPELLKQLHHIIELNNQLYAESGESLDFVGMPGFMSWVKRQFKKIILRKSDFEVSNILVDEKTKRLYIIDTDVLRTQNVPLKTALISRVGLFVNRMLMKWYFRKDIKHGELQNQSPMISQPQPAS